MLTLFDRLIKQYIDMTTILRFIVEPTTHIKSLDIGKEPLQMLFHLEDETFQLLRPTRGDFGLREGSLLGRQRVKQRDAKSAQDYVTLDNIANNLTVDLIGRSFKVVGCDRATRSYLVSHGLPSPPLLHVQSRPASTPLQSITDGHRKTHGNWPSYKHHETYLQGRPLRFYGEFINEPRPSGVTVIDHRKVELLFYLDDYSAELNLVPFGPSFEGMEKPKREQVLHRQRIIKDGGLRSLGSSERPALNLSCGNNGIRILDRHPDAPSPPDELHPKDLILGSAVKVSGRNLRLCECDDVTKAYYKDVMAIDQIPVSYQLLNESFGRNTTPPRDETNKGKLEDIPKDPKHPLPTSFSNSTVYAKKVRDTMDNVVLRLTAKLKSKGTTEDIREFIISWFLVDSTVSVYEIEKPNSGIRSGFFLGRSLVEKTENEFLSNEDFWVGKSITIYSHIFKLLGADEFSLQYMESHSSEFPQANYEIAKSRIRNIINTQPLKTELAQKIRKLDLLREEILPVDLVLTAIEEFCASINGDITRHHILTLVRQHRVDQYLPLTQDEISHIASLHLKRVNFNETMALRTTLQIYDKEKTGKVAASTMKSALKSAKFPLPKELLEALVRSYEDERGDIEYQEFLRRLDPFYRVGIHCSPPCELSEAAVHNTLQRHRSMVKYNNLLEILI